MSYKTILVHWDDAAAERHAAAAAGLARRFGAHLTMMCFGIDAGVAAYSFGAPGAGVIAAQTEAARSQAEALRDQALAWLAQAGVAGEAREHLCPLDLLGATVADEARLADLVVVGPPYDAAREDVTVRVLEGALFEGSAPVLVCPETMPEKVGRKVIIAWDGGLEALHAVRGAMGFLREAEAVELLLIDPEPGEDAFGEPGAAMAMMLSRHGLPVTVAQVPSAGQTVAKVLTQRMMDTGADLLVMGAYGHSRLREALIGGPTRDILAAVPCPVLMAH